MRGDLHGLKLVAIGSNDHSLLVGMGHDSLQVLGIQRVEYGEEIFSRRPFASWVLVGKELHEGLIGLQVRPKVLHTELIIMRDSNLFGLPFLEELLPIGEDILEEVFRHDAFVGEVVLHYKQIR